MRLTSTIFLLVATLSLHAQHFLTITGTIVDQKTGQPVGYAHVGIPENGIGTISGFDGEFILKIPDYYRNSTLTVSFIGYQTYRKPVGQIESPVRILLKQVATSLPEVVVRDESGIEDIIRRAVANIPKNYPTRSTSMTGFYRESKTDAKQEYQYLAEGVLDIYKTSYNNKKEGQTGLIQGRQVVLNPTDSPEEVASISSGHLSPHRFDFVKHREEFIDEANFDDYQYWIEGITSYDDKPVYIIGFDRAEGGSGRMTGKVYIDTLSYAFIRAEFEIRPEGLKKINDYPLYVGSWNANRYVANYRKIGDKWYFSSALREGERPNGGLFSNDILITEVDTKKSKPVPYGERLERGAPFLTITGQYDDNFWREYNTAPLNSGQKESVLQMKTQEKAAEVFDADFMAALQARRDSIRLEALRTELGEVDPETGEPIELPQVNNGVLEVQKRKFGVQLQMHLGAGAHLLSSEAATLGLTRLQKDEPLPIISTTGEVPAREYEALLNWDLSLLFNRRWFIRWGITRESYNSIYREHSFGLGWQFNLTPDKRPFFLRPSIQHSRLDYARKVGVAENDFGKFKAGGEKLRSDEITMYYGSRVHFFKPSLEMALELNPDLDLFIRGSYLLPFADNRHLYLREKGRVFRRKARTSLDNDHNLVERDDAPFNGKLADYQSFLISIGVVFK